MARPSYRIADCVIFRAVTPTRFAMFKNGLDMRRFVPDRPGDNIRAGSMLSAAREQPARQVNNRPARCGMNIRLRQNRWIFQHRITAINVAQFRPRLNQVKRDKGQIGAGLGLSKIFDGRAAKIGLT